jgi:hypothetical protein
MGFQLSPGVKWSEYDASGYVPAFGTTTGAISGVFQWGPTGERVLVDNISTLEKRFGKPDNNTALDFFTAANFLSYGNSLIVTRALVGTAKNAVSGAGSIASLAIGAGGSTYTTATVAFSGGGGTGAAATATITSGAISAVTITNRGTGYTSAPTVTITGDGTGATVTATLVSAITIGNLNSYEQSYAAGEANVGMFTAKYPGDLGNSLKVSIADSSSFTGWAYETYFDSAPSVGEVHVIVIDENGKFSNGVADTVLEKFAYISKYSDAKTADGATNYYANVISRSSKYIWWTDHPFGSTNWGVTTGSATASVITAMSASLALGVAANNAVTAAEIIDGLNLFVNGQEVDVNLILGSAHVTEAITTDIYQHIIDNIVEVRKDCVAFLSPLKSNVVNNYGNEHTDVLDFKNTTIDRSTSYGVMDGNWKYQYDKYNDLHRWTPCNGDVAGLCVRTDTDRDPWYSPAGFNRGQIKNVTKLAWEPSESYRDQLYKGGVNPIVSFPGQGVVLYGDKTMLAKPSAFDRINVRRLFIVLEKSIAKASQYTLFEFNDEFTRMQFRNLVEPFLRDVQGRRGIIDFRVVCDASNNTGEVIDRNEFIGDIYIKPARSINFIQLNFVAVRTGVAFEEIVGKAF